MCSGTKENGVHFTHNDWKMATNQYSDLFTYGTFDGIQDWRSVSYQNVVLLKDLCGKKAGATIDKIILDTTTGKFTVPRTTRASTAMETAARTLVEFKGVHTRFPDDEDSGVPEDSDVPEDDEQVKKTYTLKLYENKRKLFRPDSNIKLYVLKGLTEATLSRVISESTGPRGELLVTIETNVTYTTTDLKMVPFTVCTARNRSRTCYFSEAA